MRRALGASLIVGLGIGIGLLGLCQPVGPFDEGLVLCGAQRILHGELPYRDFFAPYPPGQFYIVAGVQAVFGRSVLTLRIYCIVVRALLAWLLYLNARQFVGRPLAAMVWGMAVIWLTAYGDFGYPTFPALLLVVASLTMLASCVDSSRPGFPVPSTRLLLAGLAMGIAGLIRHDLAVYGLLASVPAAVVLVRRRENLGHWWRYPLGVGVGAGVPAVWLLAKVPLHEVVFELWTYATKIYPPTRRLPYPQVFPHGSSSEALAFPFTPSGIAAIPFHAPLWFCGLTLILLALRLRHPIRATEVGAQARLAGMTLLSMLAFNLALVRADAPHGAAMLLPSFVVAAALVQDARTRLRRWRVPAVGAIAALCVVSMSWPIQNFPRSAILNLLSARGASAAEPPADCMDVGRARAEAARFIRLAVPAGGRIFVGCWRHDKVWVNEPIVYYLADRLPGTRYHSFDPGVTTTLEVQDEIVRELVKHRVEYLVLSDSLGPVDEPNLSALSSGVTRLDDYLRAHYELRGEFEPSVTVWRRRDGFEPASSP